MAHPTTPSAGALRAALTMPTPKYRSDGTLRAASQVEIAAHFDAETGLGELREAALAILAREDGRRSHGLPVSLYKLEHDALRAALRQAEGGK